MSTDRLPGFGMAGTRGAPGPSRLLTRALARPSLPATVGLVVVVVLFGIRAPELLTVAGAAAVLEVAAPLGIGAVAVTLLMVAGQFDVSVGIVAVASALVTALLTGYAGWAVWPALGVSLLCALLVGVVNGVLVVNTGLPSFLVTLATLLVLQGVTLVGTEEVTGSAGIVGLSDSPGWTSAAAAFSSTVAVGDARFRISVLWWLGITAVATWVLWRTRFGNAVLAIGGARHAARELGVAVRRTTVALFCLTATAGWFIGTLGLLRLGGVSAVPGLASGVDYLVVAVIGGCLLTGGRGSAVGAAVSALLYAVARQGILLAGWDLRWFQALLGVLLLVALLANGAVRRRLKAVPRS
ncbi:ABC transporter permease [Geodermatophilus sp. YIM 151500]|uniref:ABC transporter permease n=1 Tax=Geodermatophilus sp. YIM 151500 TaxID=2984531 RepID=UPI0021E3D7E8|nr:ABC transporter permease [Geodermatophilus sp. YIM 151500]MCV2490246.1 ABC transporter permease [Geodermatophilus sp. YIM 151500]